MDWKVVALAILLVPPSLAAPQLKPDRNAHRRPGWIERILEAPPEELPWVSLENQLQYMTEGERFQAGIKVYGYIEYQRLRLAPMEIEFWTVWDGWIESQGKMEPPRHWYFSSSLMSWKWIEYWHGYPPPGRYWPTYEFRQTGRPGKVTPAY